MSTRKVSFSVHAIVFAALSCFCCYVSAAACGNNRIQQAEVCDGANLDGQSCTTLGFEGGSLACAADCSAFDTSACISTPVCGNNTIELGEVCDSANLGGQSCTTLGFDAGNLACAADCSAFDTSFCISAVCGNNIVEGGELCDSANLNGQSCTDLLGFEGGSLACAADCTFDTSACISTPVCGNNTIEPGEVCDSANLGGQSCTTLGFEGGSLACAADCSAFDTIACATTSDEFGIKAQIVGIQEQLVQIESGVDKLGESVDEIASANRAICDRPVSWNRKLPDNERFALALNGGAYCDLETGLIWMEEPSPSHASWKQAFSLCHLIEVDGRKGWNLPTVEQLSTLIDSKNVGSGPALPPGHPFKGVLDDVFWTSSLRETSLVGRTRQVWLVDLGIGIPITRTSIKLSEARVWCVRGTGGSPPISEAGFFGEN